MKHGSLALIFRLTVFNLVLASLTTTAVAYAKTIQAPPVVAVASDNSQPKVASRLAKSTKQPRPTTLPINITATLAPDPTTTPMIEEASASLPLQILEALNKYRITQGVGSLSWDNNLAQLAQERANLFDQQRALDNHQGFQSFTSDPDNFTRLNMVALGENSSYGFNPEATSLIEQVFTSDELHNSNQLNPDWNSVGIGTMGSAVNLIFGQRL